MVSYNGASTRATSSPFLGQMLLVQTNQKKATLRELNKLLPSAHLFFFPQEPFFLNHNMVVCATEQMLAVLLRHFFTNCIFILDAFGLKKWEILRLDRNSVSSRLSFSQPRSVGQIEILLWYVIDYYSNMHVLSISILQICPKNNCIKNNTEKNEIPVLRKAISVLDVKLKRG